MLIDWLFLVVWVCMVIAIIRIFVIVNNMWKDK